jgi:hypothetical protein
MMARTTTPPMTPPAIAPVFEDFLVKVSPESEELEEPPEAVEELELPELDPTGALNAVVDGEYESFILRVGYYHLPKSVASALLLKSGVT